ncbi:MAG: 50S ribosomal protein L25 [Sporolactobacillus sp.]
MARLAAVLRDSSKKSVIHSLRNAGKIPSVVYGKTVSSEPIAVDAAEVTKLLSQEGRNAVIALDVEGKKRYTVMVHDLQLDPIKGTIRHADFLAVNLNETLDAVVPVELVNREVVESGEVVLNHQTAELTVRALPNNLPATITVDVSGLKAGESIRVSDITPDGDYEIVSDPEETIVSLTYGAAEEEAPAETEESAGIPEV